MLIKRIIPSLLIKNGGLVKTTQFKNPSYIGDPINTVKIFNEKEVDEIVIFDIDASSHNKKPNFELLHEMASEAFMPLMYGGGIKNLEDMSRIFNIGFEKICVSSLLFENPQIIKEAIEIYGAQSIVACLDVKKGLLKGDSIYIHNGKKKVPLALKDAIKHIQDIGVGELIINSISRDGTYKGFDLELINLFSNSLDIPVIPVGGASHVKDFLAAFNSGASGAAAGSLFVYNGIHRAVLISYPKRSEIEQLLRTKEELS